MNSAKLFYVDKKSGLFKKYINIQDRICSIEPWKAPKKLFTVAEKATSEQKEQRYQSIEELVYE